MTEKKYCPRNERLVFAECTMCNGRGEDLRHRSCATQAALRSKELYNHEHTKAYSK